MAFSSISGYRRLGHWDKQPQQAMILESVYPLYIGKIVHDGYNLHWHNRARVISRLDT
jgi:hypothetical protein